MKTKFKVATFVFGLMLALGLAALIGVRPASADTNQCPSGGTGNPQTDNLVGASFTTSSNTATYTFSSFTNESPSGGIPGLIAYCVYPSPSTAPDSTTAVAVGANGAAWVDPPAFDNFSFQRPDGDPSNIKLDGTTGITMGTATWNGGVPASQMILLHINDPAVCNTLYGGNPGTCFVLPGTPQQQAQDLAVSKVAAPSFDLKYTWSITKDVDKTVVKQIGGTATFNYTVRVSHDSGTPGNWQVKGTITVTNPNGFDVNGVNVADAVDNGGSCSVSGGSGLTVPANSSVQVPYTCTYSSAPGPSSGSNTATATWNGTLYNTPDSSASGSAAFDFSTVSPTLIDDSVSVTDTLGGMLGTVKSTDPSPTTFTYSKTFPVPQYDCVSYTNIATFTTNTTSTTGSASRTVKVCGPVHTGALTMGFWQNKNGQGIITGGSSTSGVCNSGTWLRGYAPFQDLSATATCSQVASYVSGVIKAATCSGSTCNAMLKAQMLATALDVYFSDPTMGGNKIGAPAPIGGVTIDLTMICQMIDGSGGTATCSGTFENVSSAFGGATSLTVSQMLSYAASQSNVGGSTWYGQVKATQVLAKDAFDAINNQLAFAP